MILCTQIKVFSIGGKGAREVDRDQFLSEVRRGVLLRKNELTFN